MRAGDRIRFPGGQIIFTIRFITPAWIHASTDDGGVHLLDRDVVYEPVPEQPNLG